MQLKRGKKKKNLETPKINWNLLKKKNNLKILVQTTNLENIAGSTQYKAMGCKLLSPNLQRDVAKQPLCIQTGDLLQHCIRVVYLLLVLIIAQLVTLCVLSPRWVAAIHGVGGRVRAIAAAKVLGSVEEHGIRCGGWWWNMPDLEGVCLFSDSCACLITCFNKILNWLDVWIKL